MPDPNRNCHERACKRRGFTHIAGVDEAGRGPLAGPVVAAAVILDRARPVRGIDDSKKLPADLRELLFGRITRSARAWAVAAAGPEEIDRLNILRASLLAMRRAVLALAEPPDCLLVDGRDAIDLPVWQKPIIRGDALSLSIGAASILAKVTRDRIMVEMHRRWPAYNFARHKGYPTPEHLEALRRFGPCPIHRRSFRGVLSADGPVGDIAGDIAGDGALPAVPAPGDLFHPAASKTRTP
jgi:ribonuclease HII